MAFRKIFIPRTQFLFDFLEILSVFFSQVSYMRKNSISTGFWFSPNCIRRSQERQRPRIHKQVFVSDRKKFRVILSRFVPNELCNEVLRLKDFIEQESQSIRFKIINAHEDYAILAQELPEQREAWIHHAKPFVVAGKVFGFLANNFTKPFTDERAVNAVVVNPAFVASVVRRVNVDALDLSGVVRQQRLERDEVVAAQRQAEIASTRAR